ncbi:MAG: tRNA (N6-isopentenyl adenosine(37)-C2)-methylthiotransferase MiaB [Bacillota bacterium]|nr:tRNA (N6-isopentenyl adenosine(37)-C2)-methylthiotransferase MiaB [Bacillota bacterium]
MDKKTYYIQTFGCQMNERDSETLAGMLAELGYRENPFRSRAQVVILNTCSVRENADKRFFGTLGQLKKQRLEEPEGVVAVCGCMMQQQHVIDTLKAKYPWVDLVFGTHNIHQFPELLQSVMAEQSRRVATWEEGGEVVEGLPALRKYPFKAYVNIMYGCNNFCTYCIVPYTRGRERSRKPGDILAEVKGLAAEGVREVTLLGQNVNSYQGPGTLAGEDVTTFPRLICMLQEVEGLERIRFMTSHPKDLSRELIRAYADCGKLCRHIHLPVQSGSTEILRRMNRRYTREDYLSLVERLRDAVPEIAVTTDVIVGFPGETEKDFQDTLDLVEQVRFDSAFTFLYSIRKGTPAEKYGDQVPEEVKHSRFNQLVEAVNAISAEKNRAWVGRTAEVLAEGPGKGGGRNQSGRTSGHKLVNFTAKEEVTGRLVPVKITSANTFSLEGEMV